MPTRNILNADNEIIGQLTLPDSTSEQEWSERLASYVVDTNAVYDSYLRFSIQERKRYAEDLLERYKKENLKSGINALQALHMHDKMRALPVTFMGMNFTIDILNLAISGDIEVCALALIYTTGLDDGSQPYHWFTAGRRDWLVNDMKSFLGWT